jgi:hypothetical protein
VSGAAGIVIARSGIVERHATVVRVASGPPAPAPDRRLALVGLCFVLSAVGFEVLHLLRNRRTARVRAPADVWNVS